MLHRIAGRATKCGLSAISAIAGVPTHGAAAVIRTRSREQGPCTPPSTAPTRT